MYMCLYFVCPVRTYQSFDVHVIQFPHLDYIYKSIVSEMSGKIVLIIPSIKTRILLNACRTEPNIQNIGSFQAKLNP